MADQFGVELEIGVGVTVSGYCVQGYNEGDKDIESFDVDDGDGVRKTRVVLKRDDIIELELIAESGTDPKVDFPKGDFCALTAFSNLWVDAFSFQRTKEAAKVNVTLKNIGASLVPTP